jgi:anti-sigma B factor antagonist
VELTITWQHPTNRSIVLALTGALDHAGAVELRAAISAAVTRQPRAIVVDLAGVERIDEAGVGTLVVADRICRQIGIDLAVRSPSPLIERLLGITGTPGRGRRSPAASGGTG